MARLQAVAKSLASPVRQPVFKDAAAGSEAVTLEAISALLDSKLDNKLAPLTAAVGELQSDMQQLKLDTAIEAGALAQRVGHMEAMMSETTKRLDKLEDNAATSGSTGATHQAQETARQQLQDLERQLAELKAAKVRTATAVVGGMGFSRSGRPRARRGLLQGQRGNFRGLLFANFADENQRDSFVHAVRNSGWSVGDVAVWAKPDQPLDIRTVESYQFGLRRLLVERGFNRAAVRVESGTLFVEGAAVVTPKIVDGAFVVEWRSQAWEDWAELRKLRGLQEHR